MSAEQRAADVYGVVNGWLVQYVNEHTCGTGRDGYYGAHEPGCGMEPLARVDDLLADSAALARAGLLTDAECGDDECDNHCTVCGRCIRWGSLCSDHFNKPAPDAGWPCDNYTRPVTCLSAPSSASGRCLFCSTMATADAGYAAGVGDPPVRSWQDETAAHLLQSARVLVEQIENGCPCPDDEHSNRLHDLACDVVRVLDPAVVEEAPSGVESCNGCGHPMSRHWTPGGCHFSGTARSCRCGIGGRR